VIIYLYACLCDYLCEDLFGRLIVCVRICLCEDLREDLYVRCLDEELFVRSQCARLYDYLCVRICL
jgi:hypothetical protein